MRRSTPDRRLKTLRIHHRKFLRLCSLAAEIAKLGDERATLRKIVNTAASLIGVQSAHLALVDREEQTLYGVARSGRRSPNVPGLRVDLSRSAAAHQALRRRMPISIDVSPQTETMLGYPSSEWTDDPDFWMKIIHPDDVRPPRGLKDREVRTT